MFISPIKIIIMSSLNMSLKKPHSECFPERRVRFNNKKKHKKTPWITKLMGYYDPLILEINYTRN